MVFYDNKRDPLREGSFFIGTNLGKGKEGPFYGYEFRVQRLQDDGRPNLINIRRWDLLLLRFIGGEFFLSSFSRLCTVLTNSI